MAGHPLWKLITGQLAVQMTWDRLVILAVERLVIRAVQ